MSAKRDKSINLIVGKNIRAEREKAGMKQSTLAEKIGMEPSSLSSAERGNVGVSLERIKKICEVLSIPSDRILFGEIEKNDVQDITERLERLTPKQLRVVHNIIIDVLDAFSLDTPSL